MDDKTMSSKVPDNGAKFQMRSKFERPTKKVAFLEVWQQYEGDKLSKNTLMNQGNSKVPDVSNQKLCKHEIVKLE